MRVDLKLFIPQAGSFPTPQVQHWYNVLGGERIRVVTTEEIKKDQAGVMAMVLSFIGLCPFKFGRLGPDNVTPFTVPKHMKIQIDHYKLLQEFFRPFNALLYALIGRDLGWESSVFASLKA